ncbi:lysophospholipid acyltransferase family protein [Pseudonocardia sp. MH-G8]|uniref:lysophospholipid acyltransferase family protein n=1 Tax=Pseudonocardia sp. MH-G8 TaxID=1854588 RepID=UPI0018E97D0F|nr:lysophospholipid acyltransferase family protein [Pseudonocardia sp. MH-G8]
MTARAAAALRHLLWRVVLTITGGLTVTGSLPCGGCVVVANHGSHADTAALLAAMDSRHAPRVAAAADYWFAGGWRSAICRALAAAFPVRRTGGGSADIAAAVALLQAGRAVVVYPEGTRGSGAPARFHAGAFRLAAAAGVPVVPVGIVGTTDLLPKHGKLRRNRVEVRIGTPLPADADAAREAVARLARLPRSAPSRRPSRERAARLAASRTGVALVAVWAVAEAVVWPLLPECVLFALVVAAPRAGLRLVPTAVLASMAGGLCTLALGAAGAAPAAPLVTERMRVAAAQQTAAEGAYAARHQPLSGIPFKVYAAEAGRAGVAPLPFLAAAATHRGLRIASVGAACALLGVGLHRWPRAYPAVLLAGYALFTAGLVLVVRGWT